MFSLKKKVSVNPTHLHNLQQVLAQNPGYRPYLQQIHVQIVWWLFITKNPCTFTGPVPCDGAIMRDLKKKKKKPKLPTGAILCA